MPFQPRLLPPQPPFNAMSRIVVVERRSPNVLLRIQCPHNTWAITLPEGPQSHVPYGTLLPPCGCSPVYFGAPISALPPDGQIVFASRGAYLCERCLTDTQIGNDCPMCFPDRALLPYCCELFSSQPLALVEHTGTWNPQNLVAFAHSHTEAAEKASKAARILYGNSPAYLSTCISGGNPLFWKVRHLLGSAEVLQVSEIPPTHRKLEADETDDLPF